MDLVGNYLCDHFVGDIAKRYSSEVSRGLIILLLWYESNEGMIHCLLNTVPSKAIMNKMNQICPSYILEFLIKNRLYSIYPRSFEGSHTINYFPYFLFRRDWDQLFIFFRTNRIVCECEVRRYDLKVRRRKYPSKIMQETKRNFFGLISPRVGRQFNAWYPVLTFSIEYGNVKKPSISVLFLYLGVPCSLVPIFFFSFP